MSISIKGFSKFSKEAKLEWIVKEYLKGDESKIEFLKSYWHSDKATQKLHDEFIENTITNFYLPFGIAPNFQINNKLYCLPMAIEESSVVAAASKSANFWLERGGFKAEVISKIKIGHVHFYWKGTNLAEIQAFFESIKHKFFEATNSITSNMRARGGGILDIQLINKTDLEPNYYQIEAHFDTCDSMGANFINSCLEEFSGVLKSEITISNSFSNKEDNAVDVIMSILSNYTPQCIVRAWVECDISNLSDTNEISGEEFAEKFQRAIRIAEIEPYRATTHNKGIFNGIDAVVIATGNDFRAVEACGHAYAARNGKYSSLTHCEVKDGKFKFWIDLPIALGVVGGLTNLHPMVKFAHDLLEHPNAEELMCIIASSGLAQNFAAIRALVTTGIQKGHMKMHLLNILNQFGSTEQETEKAKIHFIKHVVTYKAVTDFLSAERGVEISLNTKHSS